MRAEQTAPGAIRLAAGDLDCLSNVRLGERLDAQAILAEAASVPVEEYLRLHSQAVEASEQSALRRSFMRRAE